MLAPSNMGTQVPPSALLEAFFPQQKLIDGKPFPKIFVPSPSAPVALQGMLHVLQTNRPFLDAQLHEHGAVLLRDFPLQSAADFDALMEAIGWEHMPYVGLALRHQVKGRAYTANECPPHLNLPFHHENIQLQSGPASKIVFYCDVEPAEGGETPILLSHKVTEKMEEEFPDFVQKLGEEGLLYIKTLPATTESSVALGRAWPIVLGTKDRAEAERLALQEFGARLEWLLDGSVHMVGGPYEPIRVFDEKRGRKAWFNLILVGAAEAEWKKETTGSQLMVVFKDRSALPSKEVTRCKELHEEMSVDMPWHKGDVMILDNLAVMHGRRPCYHPRKILVALCH